MNRGELFILLAKYKQVRTILGTTIMKVVSRYIGLEEVLRYTGPINII